MGRREGEKKTGKREGLKKREGDRDGKERKWSKHCRLVDCSKWKTYHVFYRKLGRGLKIVRIFKYNIKRKMYVRVSRHCEIGFCLFLLPDRAIATFSTPPNGANASRALEPKSFSR